MIELCYGGEMKKHIFHVGVGPDMPPAQVMIYLTKIERAFEEKSFFPKGTVVFIPTRDYGNRIEEVEVDGF